MVTKQMCRAAIIIVASNIVPLPWQSKTKVRSNHSYLDNIFEQTYIKGIKEREISPQEEEDYMI